MAGLDLSELEAKILIAVDNAGWHCDLWFPIVQRAMLNLSSDQVDEEIHRSLVGLIRKGLLTEIEMSNHPSGHALRTPEWQPRSDALAAAKMCLRHVGVRSELRRPSSDAPDALARLPLDNLGFAKSLSRPNQAVEVA